MEVNIKEAQKFLVNQKNTFLAVKQSYEDLLSKFVEDKKWKEVSKISEKLQKIDKIIIEIDTLSKRIGGSVFFLSNISRSERDEYNTWTLYEFFDVFLIKE